MREKDPNKLITETSELYGKPLFIFSVKNSIIFTVFGHNELIFPLSQNFVHLLNLLLYFVLVVSLHAADIFARVLD